MKRQITITGINHYYGHMPFKKGMVVKLKKDDKNLFDAFAIEVCLPVLHTVGYVSNSVGTTHESTICANMLYEKIGDIAYGKVEMVVDKGLIATIIPKKDGKKKYKNQKENKHFFENAIAILGQDRYLIN